MADIDTPELQDIRKRRADLLVELRRVRAQEKRVQFELGVVRDDCPHLNAYDTSHMGENCHHCPDCGGCDVRA